MRNRLLASAAILVAGVALASAQNAPAPARGETHNHGAGRPSSEKNRSVHAAPAGKSAPQRPATAHAGAAPAKPHLERASQPRDPRAAREQAPVPTRRAATPGPAPGPAPAREAHGEGRLMTEGRSGGNGRHRRMHGDGAAEAVDVRKEKTSPRAGSQAPHRPSSDQGMGRAEAKDAKTLSAKTQSSKTRSSKTASKAAQSPKAQPAVHARSAGSGAHAHGTADATASDIHKAQAALNRHGFKIGNPDGKLGPRTKQALIAFQRQHGLTATGKADNATLQALNAAGVAPPAGDNPAGQAGAGPQQAAPLAQQAPAEQAAPAQPAPANVAAPNVAAPAGDDTAAAAPPAAPAEPPAAAAEAGTAQAQAGNAQVGTGEPPAAVDQAPATPGDGVRGNGVDEPRAQGDASPIPPVGAPQQDFVDDAIPSADANREGTGPAPDK